MANQNRNIPKRERRSLSTPSRETGVWVPLQLDQLGARPDRRCDGHCCRLASSGSVCEGEQLQEVVGGADHGPFGAHFLYAPQQELAEAASLFDLSEHRFHHLLSQSVGCFEAAVVDLFRIRWVSGPPIFPFAAVGCLARPGAT